MLSQPILVAQGTSDPYFTLISGITSSDTCFKYFAYSELKQLTIDQSPGATARRTALFGDLKYNLWSRLVREGLLLLGQDYQTFLRRGQEATPSTGPAAPDTASAPPPTTPTPLIKGPIFKTLPQSPIRTVANSLAADGSFSQVVEATAGAAQIPDLFRPMQSIVPPSIAALVKDVELKKGLGVMSHARSYGRETLKSMFDGYVPLWARSVAGEWGDWWGRERLSKVMEVSLPRREIDVLVVEGGILFLHRHLGFFLLMYRAPSALAFGVRISHRRPIRRRPTGYTPDS